MAAVGTPLMPNVPPPARASRKPGADPRQALRAALRRAELPPSGQDPQPWLFRLAGPDTLELHLDRSRVLSVADPDRREAVISCGAALFRVRVALHALGHAGRVQLLPDALDRDHLARIRLGAARTPSPADGALALAMHGGQGDGRGGEDGGIAPHVLSLLLGAARMEQAWLGFVETPALRLALSGLVIAAHRRQRDDPRRRREHVFRAHQNEGTRSDGLPAAYPGSPGFLSYLGLPVPRSVGRDPEIEARVERWVQRAATVAVLTTRGDGRADWLVAGQALARVLLTAHACGVAASYLNQPVQVPEFRPRVAALVRAASDPGVPGRRGGMPAEAVPQIVLRLGAHAAPPADASRDDGVRP